MGWLLFEKDTDQSVYFNRTPKTGKQATRLLQFSHEYLLQQRGWQQMDQRDCRWQTITGYLD